MSESKQNYSVLFQKETCRTFRFTLVGSLIFGMIWGMGCATSEGMKRSRREAKKTSYVMGSDSSVSGEPVVVTDLQDSSARELQGSSTPTVPSLAKQVEFRGMRVRGIEIENSRFDYPMVVNESVLKWVDYFTGRGRGHFARYLERSEHFIPFIQPILKENGMPEDLVYLAMIESGFNNHARSHAKAVGPWQFISATGKRYGLMINWWVDERRDTHKSTLSAIQYLKDLYGMFQSWELAAAAYNAGEAKIARAVRRYGTKDFWVIARQRFLRPETRDYVPKIMAAAIVAKNRELFGFEPSRLENHEGEVLAGDGEFVKVVEDKNPELPAEEGKAIDSIQALIEKEANEYESGISEEDLVTPARPLLGESEGAIELKSTRGATAVATPTVNKQGQVSGEQVVEFEVQSPADLLKVARAAGLSYQTVKAINPELLRWVTPPTVSTYRIKLPMAVRDRFLANYNHPDFPRKTEFLAYRVRRNESIQGIARQFGIRVDPLSDLNSLSPTRSLKNGHLVLLPLPKEGNRSIATLDVKDPPDKKLKKKRRRSRARFVKVTQQDRVKARQVNRTASQRGGVY